MSPTIQNRLPNWRSLLFMPTHVNRFIESAPKRGADAIILDLEDSVPLTEKSIAREQLKQHAEYLAKQAMGVLVRINRDLINAVADLEVSVNSYVDAIIIPKVLGPEHIKLLDEVVTELEIKHGLESQQIKFIALIEDIKSLSIINDIAQSSTRLCGLGMGTEDLALDGGFEPTTENLTLPSQHLIFATRIAKINAYGFPGSIADYSDLEKYQSLQQQAKSMGFNGALCIHPSQVAPINETYAVTELQRSSAKRIIEAYEDAINNKRGAVEVDGKMVDTPVYEKALSIINSSKSFSN